MERRERDRRSDLGPPGTSSGLGASADLCRSLLAPRSQREPHREGPPRTVRGRAVPPARPRGPHPGALGGPGLRPSNAPLRAPCPGDPLSPQASRTPRGDSRRERHDAILDRAARTPLSTEPPCSVRGVDVGSDVHGGPAEGIHSPSSVGYADRRWDGIGVVLDGICCRAGSGWDHLNGERGVVGVARSGRMDGAGRRAGRRTPAGPTTVDILSAGAVSRAVLGNAFPTGSPYGDIDKKE